MIFRKGFIPFVENEWKSLVVHGRGNFVLKEKFCLIKEKLKWWNKFIFSKYDMEVEEGVSVLNDHDGVPGKSMVDRVLVANELVDYSNREGKECFLFKMDFKKTYDKVSWNFLMGLGIRWMESLVFTSNSLLFLLLKEVIIT